MAWIVLSVCEIFNVEIFLLILQVNLLGFEPSSMALDINSQIYVVYKESDFFNGGHEQGFNISYVYFFLMHFPGNMLKKSNENLALLLPSVQQQLLQLEINCISFKCVCVCVSTRPPPSHRWQDFYNISCSIFGLCCRLFGFSILFSGWLLCPQAATESDWGVEKVSAATRTKL